MKDRHLCKARPLGTRKQWVVGFYAVLGEKTVIIEKEPEKNYDIEAGKISYGNRIVKVMPETVCQCTGLKDKNGKLIFENDIVRCGDMTVVVWNEHFASWCLIKKGWMYHHFFGEVQNPEDCEVIGNKIDNPELLEGNCDGE